MRLTVVLGVSVLALAACQKKSEEAARTGEAPAAVAAAPSVPGAPPKRKLGLWTQTVSSAGTAQSMKICLDAATEAKMTAWGQAVGQDTCTKNRVAPAPGGGWAIDSECELGEAGHIVSKGVITGDFNTAYEGKITSTTTGAAMAQMNGTRETTIGAKWEGPCPADMTPGDIRLANGMTMNITNMAGQ